MPRRELQPKRAIIRGRHASAKLSDFDDRRRDRLAGRVNDAAPHRIGGGDQCKKKGDHGRKTYTA
jgi:hypothetical protein